MEAYGLNLPDGMSSFELEIYCFFYIDDAAKDQGWDIRRDDEGVRHLGLEEKRARGCLLSRLEHFWNIVETVWGWRDIVDEGQHVDHGVKEGDGKPIVRNDWVDDMLTAMIEEEYVSLAGSASSSKSYTAALYSLVLFMCDPTGSLFLITSTSLEGARLRVWKTVNDLWSRIPIKDRLGEMVHSKCQIRGFNTKGEKSDDIGLRLIAAGSGSSQDAYDRLIGMKADRLYLIADELPQLPRGVIDAANGNLVNGSEKQPFQMISMGNPNLMTDPFGLMSTPLKGWDSVNEGDYKWDTARGVCIRFDAERSPNMLAGKVLYDWLPKEKAITLAKKEFGERSLMYYRQYKAFWFREADTETIYSESDIVMNMGNIAYDPERDGQIVSQTAIAGADPSYTQGGDLFPVVVGRVIETQTGKTIIEVTHQHRLEDAVEDEKVPRSHAMVMQLEEICRKHNIAPSNFGYDGTGAGVTFADVIAREWSTLPIDVQFGGAPSGLNAGVNDQRPSKEVYRNRVTELWVRGKGMLSEGMVRGITDEILRQMIVRRWNTKSRRSGGTKLMVESKVDMKAREGESPDWADAFFVFLEVAIVNGLINSFRSKKMEVRVSPSWNKMCALHNVEGNSNLGYEY